MLSADLVLCFEIITWRLFPSWGPSSVTNKDLHIRDKVETWKALLRECPTLKRNIRLNLQLNTIRMLHFWKFKFAFIQDNPSKLGAGIFIRVFITLKDNLESPLHGSTDHNTLRATRVIEALKMFGCFSGLLKIFAEGLLFTHYRGHPSFQHWENAWRNRNIPDFYRLTVSFVL
jgi:hypothetical protein